MCFAVEGRALFRHLNFQKWSEREVLLAFALANVLRATTACTFPTSQLLKVFRTWGVLLILTWQCASRQNGVQFFISHLASWLRTRRFSKPTFRPSGATDHWKNTVFRDFPTFSRTWIFFLLTLSLPSSLLFSDSSHLCFSSVHIVGSLTSKLPSANYICIRYNLYNFYILQNHRSTSGFDCDHLPRLVSPKSSEGLRFHFPRGSLIFYLSLVLLRSTMKSYTDYSSNPIDIPAGMWQTTLIGDNLGNIPTNMQIANHLPIVQVPKVATQYHLAENIPVHPPCEQWLRWTSVGWLYDDD